MLTAALTENQAEAQIGHSWASADEVHTGEEVGWGGEGRGTGQGAHEQGPAWL